jgi:transglutaminase-like putative cysteine protease
MKLNNSRFGDLITHALLLIALLSVSWRLEATDWIPSLERIGWLIIAGYLLGVLLGVSNFKFPIVLLFTIVYTIVGVSWQAFSLVEGKALIFREVMIRFYDRLSISFYAFINNLPVDDPILFYVSLGILIWFTSVFAAYFFIRKKTPWVALVACAIFILLIEYFPPYSEHPTRYLGILVFFSLVIVGRIWYLREQDRWIEKGYRIDSETSFNIFKSVTFGSLLVVLIAWNIPTVGSLFVPGSEARTNMSESWINLRSRISNMFASLEAPFFSATDFYEDTLDLGSNIPVGYESLFMVKVPNRDDQDLRFYWRGHSFDTYRRGEWVNTLNDRQQTTGDFFDTGSDSYEGRKEIDLEFTLKANFSKTFYLPLVPKEINKSAMLIGVENLGQPDFDVMSVQTILPLQKEDVYKATVYASQPTITQLRSAGTKYPDWVLDTYLQLPEDFSPRIQDLASEIVVNAKTPYDQAYAITRYLRMEIMYEPLLVLPPQTVDPIEWMLFDSKIGFCNYYATAEVLMLRSIGVPARLAAGYAQGEAVGQDYYNIRVRDSHAWPEVYFPGVGWVEFEPTSAQPVRDLPLGETVVRANNPLTIEGGLITTGSQPEKDIDAFLDEEGIVENIPTIWDYLLEWLWLILIVLLIVSLFLIYRFVMLPRQMTVPGVIRIGVLLIGLGVPKWLNGWAEYASLSHIEKIDTQLTVLIRWCGVDLQTGSTIQEKYKNIAMLIPELNDPLQEFIGIIHESQYHEKEVEQLRLDSLANTIRRQLFSYWLTFKVKL